MPSTDERKEIQKRCEALKKLLASLGKTTSTLPYLQDISQIIQGAKVCPDNRMDELAEKLRRLLKTLKDTPAADGDAILSAARYEKFLEPGT
jgi:hypothetical protein